MHIKPIQKSILGKQSSHKLMIFFSTSNEEKERDAKVNGLIVALTFLWFACYF